MKESCPWCWLGLVDLWTHLWLSQCGGGKDHSRPLRCALEKQTKGGWTPGTVLKIGCLLYILKESLHHSCLVLGFCPDIHPLAPTSPVVGPSPPRGPSWSVFLLNILLWVIHVCVCVCVCVSEAQLCPTLCNPMDYTLPGSSVHGILQARILKWGVPFPSPEDLPNPGIEPAFSASPALASGFFTV